MSSGIPDVLSDLEAPGFVDAWKAAGRRVSWEEPIESVARLEQALLLADDELRETWGLHAVLEEAAAAIQLEGGLTDAERVALHELSAAALLDASVRRGADVARALRWLIRVPPRDAGAPETFWELAVRCDGRDVSEPSARRALPDWEDVVERLEPFGDLPAFIHAAAMATAAARLPDLRCGAAAARASALAVLAARGKLRRPFFPLQLGLRGVSGRRFPAPTAEAACLGLAAGLIEGAKRGLALHGEMRSARELMARVVAGLRRDSAVGRVAAAALGRPAFTIAGLARSAKLNPDTVRLALQRLQAAGVVHELSGRPTFRVWATSIRPVRRRLASPARPLPEPVRRSETDEDADMLPPSIYDADEE